MKLEEIDKLLGEVTPYPWTCDERYPGKVYCNDQFRTRVADCGMSSHSGRTQEQSLANARLIAAAPTIIKELVEQNKAALARNEELQRRVEKMQEVVDAAKKVITPEGMDDFYASLDELKEVFVELDAKEQDDATS